MSSAKQVLFYPSLRGLLCTAIVGLSIMAQPLGAQLSTEAQSLVSHVEEERNTSWADWMLLDFRVARLEMGAALADSSYSAGRLTWDASQDRFVMTITFSSSVLQLAPEVRIQRFSEIAERYIRAFDMMEVSMSANPHMEAPLKELFVLTYQAMIVGDDGRVSDLIPLGVYRDGAATLSR